MQAIIWIFFLLFIALGLSLIWYTLRYGISPMPTSLKVKKILLKKLPQNFSGTLYELGSGWGTLAIPLAEKYPEAQVIGYEISWIPYLFSQIRLFIHPRKNLIFKRADFLACDLSKAHLYICYLYPGAMMRLSEKLAKEAPEGAILVSHTFALPNKKPEQVIPVDDLYNTSIYFYKLYNK